VQGTGAGQKKRNAVLSARGGKGGKKKINGLEVFVLHPTKKNGVGCRVVDKREVSVVQQEESDL